MINTSDDYRHIAEQFQLFSEPERHISVFRFVCDIPYGDIGSRDPMEVLKQNKGTCSGKHALLKILLEAMGYEVQSWFAVHSFGDFTIEKWPQELMEFKGKVITDYHDFLKVKLDDRWVMIDAVFDAPLAKLGFPLLEWDGASDMALPIHASTVFPAEDDMEEHKKKLIHAFSEENQKQRKKFLSSMTRWIDQMRSKQ